MAYVPTRTRFRVGSGGKIILQVWEHAGGDAPGYVGGWRDAKLEDISERLSAQILTTEIVVGQKA